MGYCRPWAAGSACNPLRSLAQWVVHSNLHIPGTKPMFLLSLWCNICLANPHPVMRSTHEWWWSCWHRHWLQHTRDVRALHTLGQSTQSSPCWWIEFLGYREDFSLQSCQVGCFHQHWFELLKQNSKRKMTRLALRGTGKPKKFFKPSCPLLLSFMQSITSSSICRS